MSRSGAEDLEMDIAGRLRAHPLFATFAPEALAELGPEADGSLQSIQERASV